jgi:CBS domain containing-hemolysin-like protein
VILLQLLAVALLVALNVFFCRQRIRHRQSALKSACSPDRPGQPARAVDARQVTAHLEAHLSGHPAGHHPTSLGLSWPGEPILAQMLEPFFALVDVTSPALIHTGYCRSRLVTKVNQKRVYRGVRTQKAPHS